MTFLDTNPAAVKTVIGSQPIGAYTAWDVAYSRGQLYVADDGAQLGVDDDTLEAAADGLVHPPGRLGTQPEQQRDVEVHDEALGGGDGGRFLDLPRLHAELHHLGAGHDQADTGREDAIRDGAEEILHPDMPGRHHRRREVDEEKHEQAEETDAEAAEHGEEPSHACVLLVGREREAA